MHAQVIDAELAHKMYAAGFKTVRISLETSDVVRQKLTGPKVTNNGFTRAVERLKTAGFTAKDIGVYLLMGLPGQPLEEVVESIKFVHTQGVQVKPAEFTPIPGTVEWERAGEIYGFDPDSDPLLHNNCVFPLTIGKHRLGGVGCGQAVGFGGESANPPNAQPTIEAWRDSPCRKLKKQKQAASDGGEHESY